MDLDDKINDRVEKYQASKLSEHHGLHQSDSDDELLDLLDDNELARIRDDRMAQLKRELRDIDQAALQQGAGTVLNVLDEKTVMDLVTKSKNILVHFQQPTFEKCKIMNERLNVSNRARGSFGSFDFLGSLVPGLVY